MEILRWHKRFSVGHEEVDYQHKMLFDFVNRLTTSSSESHKHNEVKTIIEELIAYTEYHFCFEEELLKKHPSIVNHREIHAKFITKVHHFREEFKAGDQEINSGLFSFLISWIKNHILETDVVCFAALSEKQS